MKLNKKCRNFNYLIFFILLSYPSDTFSVNHIRNNNSVHINYNLGLENANIAVLHKKIIDYETNEAQRHYNFFVKVNKYIKTQLKSNENQLNEAILTDSNNRQAIDIVNKTINKYNTTNSSALYGRALYRQKSKNDNSISEFSEIIYDIKFDNDGIIDWSIFKGRYAIKEETINNKNFTLLSKILRVYQPNSEVLVFPLTNEFEKYYTIRIVNTITTENGNLATIKFTPLDNIKTPIIEANVVINTKSYDVIKVTGSIKNDEIKIITLGDRDAHKKNYKLNFEISYKKDTVFGLVLDYINVNHEFDYYKENTLLSHLYATSNLSFFEYYNDNPDTKKSKFKLSDPNKPGFVGYNKSFWNNNPIVNRTEVEKDIIQNFEKLNAFKAVFINSKDQISIVSSDISDGLFVQKINNSISKQYINNLTQKVFLHTDKNSYTNENKIYYSAYVTSERADVNFNEKDVLYVDLIKSGKIVDSQVLKITNGRGYGAFTRNKNFRSGSYKVVAYTNFMKNFDPNSYFMKDIELLNSIDSKKISGGDKVTLQFYPEGGNIINGINNRVAYKAVDSKGNFKNIQGKIIDSDGIFIATTKSKHEGLGFFYFKPQKGKSYAIILDDKNKYIIPRAKNTGYSIIVNNINSRAMSIDIRSSVDLKSNNIYVIGLMDNKKYYQGSFTFDDSDLISFEIPKNKLPSGVMQLVLFNESKNVIGNRSVYINNDDNINIAAEIYKKDVDNEFVKLKIKASSNTTLASDISLSITNLYNDKPIDSNDNLISHFKLSSFPQDDRITKYINKADRASNYKLDLMMLINDPIDFKWLEEPSNYLMNKYKHEKRIGISGIAKDKKNILLKSTKVELLTKSKVRIWNYEAKTDENGIFTIYDFEEVDSTNLEFRTYDIRKKQIFSEISLIDKVKFNYVDKINLDEGYLSDDFNLDNSGFDYYDEGELLDDVVINAKVEKKNSRKSYLNVSPDNVIEGEDLKGGGNLMIVLSRIPGLRYQGGTISIRGSAGSPLWLLDGMIIDNPNSINFNDVDRIEILKGLSKTAVYGPDGINGVVAIYYKEGVDSKYVNDISTSTFNKIIYNSSEEFNYKNKNTIFWGPIISTDQDGYLELILKRPSIDIKYINVNIQAINKSGEIGYYNRVIDLE